MKNIIKLFKANLKDLNYKFEEISDGMYLVYDFIQDEEQKRLLHLAKSKSDKEWKIAYQTSIKNQCLARFGRDDWENCVKEGLLVYNFEREDKVMETIEDFPEIGEIFINRISDIFKNTGLKAYSFSSIQRHYPGTGIEEHVDSESYSKQLFACVAYINDDYFGGEIYFRIKNVEIKAPAKSMIIFPTGQEFIHGVRTVESGPTRYAMTCFMWANS